MNRMTGLATLALCAAACQTPSGEYETPSRREAAFPAVAHWKASYDDMINQIEESGRPDCATLVHVVARSGAALDEAKRGGRSLREFAPLIAENTQYADALLVAEDGCR